MFDRRRFLVKTLGVGAAYAAGRATGAINVAGAETHDHGTTTTLAAYSDPALRRWSDPATWPDGRVPGAGDDVVVTGSVLLDVDAHVRSLVIPAGAELTFLATRSTALASSGNVVVRGRLRMRPADAAVVHTVRFPTVDEAAFVGGPTHDALASDVGLWVLGDGALELIGSRRAGWNRTGTDPSWVSGDDVRVAPTARGDHTTFAAFTPGSLVPTLQRDGVTYAAEVFNLTRNVVIEGTPGGRAHVFINSTQPQVIRHAALRHLGPRQADDKYTKLVLGRYGLHLHHCGDAARGTLVEGVVVAHCGNRAFVSHHSHGVTFRDCIAFQGMEDAFWWDPDTRSTYPSNASHDVAYEHCAVFGLRPDPSFRGYTLAGFALGQGQRNRCVDSVVVGNLGNRSASGFHWMENAGHMPNVWEFHGCVAHNNRAHGIYVWQNDGNDHVIADFVAYRNGGSGVDHGAYVNDHTYRDLTLFENGVAALTSHAQSRTGPAWTNLDLDGGGVAEQAVLVRKHTLDGTAPVRFERCWLRGWRTAPVVVKEASGSKPGRYDFVATRVGTDGRDLEPSDIVLSVVAPGTVIRVQRQNGTAYRLDSTGTVTVIPAFA